MSEVSDHDELYPIKWITFPPERFLTAEARSEMQPVPILIQRHNGPCSFLALCNILLLTRQIRLPSRYSDAVPFSVLADVLASYMLSNPSQDATELNSVLEVLPKTREGLDVNPMFDGIDRFAESSQAGGEMLLFKLANVRLVHGFLVDPEDELSYKALSSKSFDDATMLVAAADELAEGLILSRDAIDTDKLEKRRQTWTPEQQQLVIDGQAANHFLQSNSGQLSWTGLFELASKLEPGSLAALFRSSHLSVLYRAPIAAESEAFCPQSRLYCLITDSAFQHERLVWEGLTDPEGSSQFYEADLRPARPMTEYGGNALSEPTGTGPAHSDQLLAQQLQQEEDYRQQARRAPLTPSRPATQAQSLPALPAPPIATKPPQHVTKGKKKHCLIS